MNNIPLFPVQLVWKYSCPACMEIFLSSLYGNIPVQLVWKYSCPACMEIFLSNLYGNIKLKWHTKGLAIPTNARDYLNRSENELNEMIL